MKWDKVEHFQLAGSSCSKDYGVRNTPHVVLVDTEGKIAYMGLFPNSSLFESIETLLQGGKLEKAKEDEDQQLDEGHQIEKTKLELA